MNRPLTFSSYAEELAWHEANDKNLESCPECHDTLHEQDGDMVCHGCGHKQKIIHTSGAAAIAAPELLGLGGGGGLSGLMGGGMGGGMGGMMAGGQGLSGIGGLMNHILGLGSQQSAPQQDPNAAPMPGVISNAKVAGLLGDIVENIMHAFKNIPSTALQGLQGAGQTAMQGLNKLPEAMSDPTNPLSYADDAIGAVMPNQNQQAFAKADDTFGEDEVGTATKNDGTNSDPEEASNSGTEGKEEHGDGPEQLKDVDGDGGPTSPDEAGQLDDQGGADLLDPALQEKALKAFHLNMPLIIELAEGGAGSGTDNPIVLALDGLLEQAFPGYRGGVGGGTSEHPDEGNNEQPDDGGDDKKDDAESKKEASAWAKQGLWTVISEEDKISGAPGGTGMMGGQPNQWGSNAYPGDEFAPGAPGVAAAPLPCAQCGQNHQPGMPCVPDATQNVPQPMANGAPVGAPPPNVVTTKWEIISSYETVSMDAVVDHRYLTIEEARAAAPAPVDPPAEPRVSAQLAGPVDDEFGFYGSKTADTVGPEWMDAEGAPLQPGHQYDMVTQDYSIPDKITVDQVYPDKISYTMHPSSTDASSLPYHAELTKQEFQTMSYQFVPSEATSDDVGDNQVDHPIRPGQDATPQVDDLSTPQTAVSRVEDPFEYVSKFQGDNLGDRTWLMEGNPNEGPLVDPVLAAKHAGKDFSGQEQRAFIDEPGVARNLDQLDLEGTHYLSNDVPDEELALW